MLLTLLKAQHFLDIVKVPTKFLNWRAYTKYAIVLVGCIRKGDEDEYRAIVNDFVTWCEQNHLQLHVVKTKELVVDLRGTKTPVTPVSIRGVSVDIVEDYKYLGVHIDNKLDWAKKTETLYRKG